MIVWDMEVFKHNWMIGWLDCATRQFHQIVDDKEKFEKFYEDYKNQIWVGYGSRQYDVYIAKSILADFNPWEMNDWIINKDRKGFEFSKLLNKFPIINYDCSVGFRSLKELEAFLGDDIQESSVPFNIDRPLTAEELESVKKYNEHDVLETFKVFIETKEEFESHIGLIKEFELPIESVSKTKAQLSALILGATRVTRRDEFDIKFPDVLDLGKFDWMKKWYLDWAKTKNYEVKLDAEINGVPHTLGIGGLHGSQDKYFGEGTYIMADVASYYPAIAIEFDFLSRNVSNPKKYEEIRDERLVMKKNKDPRANPRKIVLNSTFGACKDRFNQLYDPQQANNICIAGQLLLVDLLDKLDGVCELIQSNTDGLLLKLFVDSDREIVYNICNEWSKRTRMDLEFEDVAKVIQRDVNNYLIISPTGKIKRKGAVVKKLSNLDNDLPIVNRAVVDYFTKGIPVADTVHASEKLIDFQKITKISGKYDYGSHNGMILPEKVHRCFASSDPSDGTLYKKHKSKTTLDKTASTPVNCFIDNGNILDKPIPAKLDRDWYVKLAKERIREFVGKKHG